MNTKFLAGLAAALVIVTGCVGTVSGRKTVAVPFIKDRVEGRYERPLDQVYEAAKDVVRFNGTLVNESILHGETNAVKTVEGKVNGDISADDRVELVASATVDGNIKAPKIVVAEGAKFRGNVDMGAARPRESADGARAK